ncbi:MAG: hypothetical protein ABI369_02785 [Acetobacteraceae bacterium]
MMREGDAWFVLAGVCRALGFQPCKGTYARHIAKLDREEKLELDREALLQLATPFKGGVPSSDSVKERCLKATFPEPAKRRRLGRSPRAGSIRSSCGGGGDRAEDACPSIPEMGDRRGAACRASRGAGDLPAVKPGVVMLPLQAPGHYKVTLEVGQPPRVEPRAARSIIGMVNATEREALALALRTIAVWWQKTKA